MKKLQKYTKAELISKLNGLKSNNNSDNKPTLFSEIMKFLLLFKSLLLKITFLTVIIKVFKKYSLFRRIGTLFNTILFTIFGISFIDVFEIDFLSKLFHSILDVFTNFHSNLLELFGKKPVELPSKLESLGGINQIPTEIQTNNENSERIIERFRKIINKPEEIPIQEVPVVDKPTPFYENKYVIIGGILVLSCLA
jgi:hypothetical protein